MLVMIILCPRCDQDGVKKVHIGATDQTVFFCFECEATWFCDHVIEFATFLDFSTYINRKGLDPSIDVYATFTVDPKWHLSVD